MHYLRKVNERAPLSIGEQIKYLRLAQIVTESLYAHELMLHTFAKGVLVECVPPSVARRVVAIKRGPLRDFRANMLYMKKRGKKTHPHHIKRAFA